MYDVITRERSLKKLIVHILHMHLWWSHYHDCGFLLHTLSDATMSQVAIAWVLSRPMVSSVVIGPRTLKQLDDNVGSAAITLTEEEVSWVEAG